MIDEILNRYLSRKFIAFIIATLLLVFKIIDVNAWLIVLSIYLGIEGIPDAIVRVIEANKKSSTN